jgi:hypothetical protein
MTANILRNFHAEPAGRGIVPPAKMETFTGQRKAGGMPEVGVQDKAGGVVGINNSNNNELHD